MKFIHMTSSRFESTSKIFKYLFRMNSPSISDFKVDSSPRTLSSKPSPTLKTKKIFFIHHLTINHIISKMILHHLTLLRKYWDSVKPQIWLHPKLSSRKLQDASKPLVLLTLAQLSAASPSLKLKNILSLLSTLGSSLQILPVPRDLLHLGTGA